MAAQSGGEKMAKKKSTNNLSAKKANLKLSKKKAIRKAKRENPFKQKVLNAAANVLLKPASFAANAALYNKEVSKRVSKRSQEALQIVSGLGKLAQSVKEDVRAGIKAANEVRRSRKPKKVALGKPKKRGRPRKS